LARGQRGNFFKGGIRRKERAIRLNVIKESIFDRHILPKSPLAPLFQRGEFLPLVKGGKEGFNLGSLYNYGLTGKLALMPRGWGIR
jgi:hypothetical protein